MKLQITEKLALQTNENWRITLHSFYNIIQVLDIEVNIIKKLVGDSKYLEIVFAKILELKNALTNPEETIISFNNLKDFRDIFFTNIDKAIMLGENLDRRSMEELDESLSNINRVVDIIEEKTSEFLLLFTRKSEWITYDSTEILNNLKEIFQTMALRSRGRYGVVFTETERKDTDYYLDFKLIPETGGISLPALFPDVIRDLTANARKYSRPGSTITCTLSADTEKITLKIRDEGRGIPENEIKDVVKYGFRATNVNYDEALGDGFGLTKAYIITCDNDGTMYIDSELDKYTEITLEIPRPAKIQE